MLADADLWRTSVYLGGWRPAAASTEVIEPATGAVLGSIGAASAEDVDQAVALARSVQPEWASRSAEERARVLRMAGEVLVESPDELADWLIREAGSPREKATFEIDLATGEFFSAAALAVQPGGEVLPRQDPCQQAMAVRIPCGVAGVISPFNAPLQLAARSVAPALALGNAVVLKPDPRTAVSGGVVLARALELAGLPEGVFSVLPGDGAVGASLVAHEGVDVVSFTGSTKAGLAVSAAAARNLTRAHLELGGNSALLVFPDVDLDWAARLGATGSFFNQGQICMATGRHLVHEAVAEEYVAKLAEIARSLRIGDPYLDDEVKIGPIIDARQRDRVHSLVTRSVDLGAKMVTGGQFDELFYEPTVLTNVASDTPAYAEEVFGPVASVRTFTDTEDAIAIAADSQYGLSLSILTADISRGLAVADRIPTGIAHINDQTIVDSPLAPMGGVRASGAGSPFGGTNNIPAFTDTRWISFGPAPARGVTS